MKSLTYTWTVCRALAALAAFDLKRTPFGAQASPQPVAPTRKDSFADRGLERTICDAVLLATCLYFKPVLCLQRSLCLTKLLRAHNVPARLVVGYRAVPFFSHAWVEVGGRVVNDSPVYRERLHVLYTA